MFCFVILCNVYNKVLKHEKKNKNKNKNKKKAIAQTNLVPRALFPGFGGGAPRPQSQGKAPWGRG